ncbi:MAG: hypothetical protein JW755_02225 [Candidatus Aminicenantes bacterium]|nr:hypothetical protein [Candidatus Aminicenantes bacterium]
MLLLQNSGPDFSPKAFNIARDNRNLQIAETHFSCGGIYCPCCSQPGCLESASRKGGWSAALNNPVRYHCRFLFREEAVPFRTLDQLNSRASVR